MALKEELMLAGLKGPPVGNAREQQEAMAKVPRAKKQQGRFEDSRALLVVVLEEPEAPGHPR
jgi:hypothetical protein